MKIQKCEKVAAKSTEDGPKMDVGYLFNKGCAITVEKFLDS
jgi:hypothetical protein